MTRRRVAVGSRRYDFLPDDAPLLAHRDWCIASAQLSDDVNGQPLRQPFRVRVVLPGVEDELAQDGTRARRVDQGLTIKYGSDGTFAVVGRPWLRFTPFAIAPITIAVEASADGFAPLRLAFPVVYLQRTVAAAPLAAGATVVTLNSTAGLRTGQTLLFGPQTLPQYVRIRSIGIGSQVTLDAGLLSPQAIGDPVYPDTFSSPPTVQAAMRRLPVWITGRLVTRDTSANTSTAIAFAPVWVSDFWRTRTAAIADPAHGSMTDLVPAQRQFAVALTPGALAARAVGANAGSVALPSAGDDRVLTRPAAAGGTRLDVSAAQNLQPPPSPLANRLILVDAGDPAAAEYHTVLTVQPAGGGPEPAQIATELPLANSHQAQTLVQRINAPAVLPAAPRVLRDAVAPGDRCIFIDDVAGLGPSGAMRLTGGGAADEVQRYALLRTQSDGEGYFRLPPLQRMARVAVTADDGLGNLQTIEIEPDAGQRDVRLDVVYLV